jgi:hypothetical protein
MAINFVKFAFLATYLIVIIQNFVMTEDDQLNEYEKRNSMNFC